MTADGGGTGGGGGGVDGGGGGGVMGLSGMGLHCCVLERSAHASLMLLSDLRSNDATGVPLMATLASRARQLQHEVQYGHGSWDVGHGSWVMGRGEVT